MLLRVLKRYTSVEATNGREFAAIELLDRTTGQPDHRLSVYRVDAAQVPQALCEHSVSFLTPPKRSVRGVNATDLPGFEAKPSLGKGLFAFTNQAHQELHFACDADVLTFANALVADLAARTHTLTKADMIDAVDGSRRSPPGPCHRPPPTAPPPPAPACARAGRSRPPTSAPRRRSGRAPRRHEAASPAPDAAGTLVD